MRSAKKTRVGDAYNQIKDEILSNRMPPGFQVPEPEIALRLGMSRTPVREALIRLEAEGLVELVPRRGVRVLPIHAQDMQDIYEILSGLEPEAAAQLAKRKPSAKELEPLVQTVRDMEQSLAANDLDSWADADDRFHRKLLEIHGNKRLQDYVGVLFDQAHRARMFTLRLRKFPEQSTRDHYEILELLSTGNAGAVRKLFRKHRNTAAKELLDILENYKLPQL